MRVSSRLSLLVLPHRRKRESSSDILSQNSTRKLNTSFLPMVKRLNTTKSCKRSFLWLDCLLTFQFGHWRKAEKVLDSLCYIFNRISRLDVVDKLSPEARSRVSTFRSVPIFALSCYVSNPIIAPRLSRFEGYYRLWKQDCDSYRGRFPWQRTCLCYFSKVQIKRHKGRSSLPRRRKHGNGSSCISYQMDI